MTKAQKIEKGTQKLKQDADWQEVMTGLSLDEMLAAMENPQILIDRVAAVKAEKGHRHEQN